MSFSMAGIPTAYRERRDSKPRSWYARHEKPYNGVPRRPRARRRRLYLALAFFCGLLFFYRSVLWPPREPIFVHEPDVVLQAKQDRVKAAFQESWQAYVEHGFGHDEYHPIKQTYKDMVPGGMGWIIIDALDTMLLMDLKESIPQARDWVAQHSFNIDAEVNVFETTIRMLGGLLSCYHLTKEQVYLDQAHDLGDRLLFAYNTTSGIPTASVNLKTGKAVASHDDGGSSSTAEVASLQLEMKYLSHLTGDPRYGIAAERVMERLRQNEVPGGLVPIFVDPDTGNYFSSQIRLGSRGDSYYEYLAKQWLLNDDQLYKDAYEATVRGMKEHLIGYSSPSRHTFIGELQQGIGGPLSPKMDHLVCFLPGTLALAATRGLPLAEAQKQPWFGKIQEEDMRLARELTLSCYAMYNCTTTGLAPEIVFFATDVDKPSKTSHCPDIDIHHLDRHNLMRPETVESLFVLWRITGEEQYRDWAWRIFLSFEAYLHAGEGLGYTSANNVMVNPPDLRDNMESFWLAETLKYLFLIFAQQGDAAQVPLDKVILNTEAHLLPKFSPVEGSAGGSQHTWLLAQQSELQMAEKHVKLATAGEHDDNTSTEPSFLSARTLFIEVKKAKAVERARAAGKSDAAAKKEAEALGAILETAIRTPQSLKEHERADMVHAFGTTNPS